MITHAPKPGKVTMTGTRVTAGAGVGRWARRPGYAAAAVAFAFALVSLYWVLGGTAGLSTLGDRMEQLARARDPMLIWVTGAAVPLKTLGGLLALALVQPWGRVLPRWLLLTASWAGAAVLVVYGGFQAITEGLVELGIVQIPGPVDWNGLHWHLALWDMWFLVWGLLLAAAAWQYTRRATTVWRQ